MTPVVLFVKSRLHPFRVTDGRGAGAGSVPRPVGVGVADVGVGAAGRWTRVISTSRPGSKPRTKSPDDEAVLGSGGAVGLDRQGDFPAALGDRIEEPIACPERGQRVAAQGLA